MDEAFRLAQRHVNDPQRRARLERLGVRLEDGPDATVLSRQRVLEVNHGGEAFWIIVGHIVMDVTEFMALHPSGPETILEHLMTASPEGALDAQRHFNMHSERGQQLWVMYTIGVLPFEERPAQTCIIV